MRYLMLVALLFPIQAIAKSKPITKISPKESVRLAWACNLPIIRTDRGVYELAENDETGEEFLDKLEPGEYKIGKCKFVVKK